MKPVSSGVLMVLLLALCGLCGWQWFSESLLRESLVKTKAELAKLSQERDELTAHAKTADAEILRLNGALTELRANSVAKQIHEEATAANTKLKDAVTQQNALITQQNQSLEKANSAIQQSNESLKKLTAERETLAQRLNEVTGQYNKLAQDKMSAGKKE
jgi:DNA repair exonuclease SbcCD ATPase subunit